MAHLKKTSDAPFNFQVELVSRGLDELRALVVGHLEHRRAVDLHDEVTVADAGVVRDGVERHLRARQKSQSICYLTFVLSYITNMVKFAIPSFHYLLNQ